ncbi:cytochrome P450 [Favolaschia claudopus]|uniref:Cytochrome P450 n=1 Tax=Favolaschia claudopus TaxID=2862362 RepID=A0AAW0AYK8_9AGAR
MDIIQLTAGSFIAVGIYLTWEHLCSSKSPKIPGPAPHPFVGHTLQVPVIKTWKYFERLAHEYGPIVKLSLNGNEIIVLSNPSDAEELLGRRSRNYSSRKPLIYAGKYESNNLRLSLLPYGDVLKRQRAAFHQMLQPRVLGGYEEMQLSESLRLLSDLAESPADYYNHFQRFPASLVFKLTFGEHLNDDGRDLAKGLEILTTFVQDINPNAHLVDTLPWLDMLPDFLSPWRAEARKKHAREVDFYGRLALNVKSRMEKDSSIECFAARLWDQQERFNMSDEEIFYIAGSAFLAGTDSNSVTLLWFVMAMALYPTAMKRAQEEIDAIWSSDSIPDFSRMRELPYCAAVIKEVIRWAPATPLSIPHYSDENDEYKGYVIPKGTSVISSLWGMHHNEDEFPNPYNFDPDRFLSKASEANGDVTDSLAEGHYGFGFGRRRCPGQHMAVKTTWIAVIRVLWAFKIERRKDDSGDLMNIDPEDCSSGLTIRPYEFPVKFVPRSAAHVQTIKLGRRI